MHHHLNADDLIQPHQNNDQIILLEIHRCNDNANIFRENVYIKIPLKNHSLWFRIYAILDFIVKVDRNVKFTTHCHSVNEMNH